MTRIPRVGSLLVAVAVILLVAAAAPAVADDEVRIVADGDYVRVETADGTTEAAGDWRSGGVRVSDTDSILVELGATRGDGFIRVPLRGDVLFDFGEAAVRDDAARKLARVAGLIRSEARGDVLIVGHTDSVGGEAANQVLSERRAASVIDWLVRVERIPAAILAGRGLGEIQPVAANTRADGSDDPVGRALNRRVEVYLATREGVSFRDLATEVRIDGDRVEVGGVTVDGGDVTVGDVSIGASGNVTVGGVRTLGEGGQVTCSAGRTCTEDCPDGGCHMVCPAGAICNYGCEGGNCRMECSAGARCDLSCGGGNCTFTCAMGATCQTSCDGDDCRGG